MGIFESLTGQHPLLALLLEICVAGLLAAIIWFLFSTLFALVYSALKDSLSRAASYCYLLTVQLRTLGNSAWHYSRESIHAFVAQLALKWIFLEQDAQLHARLRAVTLSVDEAGRRVERGLSEMRSELSSFHSAVETLAAPSADGVTAVAQATSEQVRQAARARRTSLVALVISTLLLLGLVALNTAMLTKFFESFVDEWLSFRWGVKVSTVLGLFWSVLEIGLGIGLYWVAQRKAARSIIPALTQVLLVVLIGFLALVETYLYYRLSYDMSLERAGAAMVDGLPAWVHNAWLAPFGFIIVVVLALLGHMLVSAINEFVDAGLQKSEQKSLEDLRRTWSSLVKSGSELQERIAIVKKRFSDFIQQTKDADDPSSAIASVQISLGRLQSAAETIRKTRQSPYTQTEIPEAHRTFALLTAVACAVPVLAILFCWTQFLYNGLAQASSYHWFTLIAGAITQALAILIAGYKIYSPVTLVIDGTPPEVLQGSRELWSTIFGALVVVAVVFYNIALGGAFGPEPFQWIPFFLAMVCVAAFALIGRTLPAIGATAQLWAKVAGMALIAVVMWIGAFVCWVGRCLFLITRTLLYLLAYPFLLIFWKNKLQTVEEEEAIGHR